MTKARLLKLARKMTVGNDYWSLVIDALTSEKVSSGNLLVATKVIPVSEEQVRDNRYSRIEILDFVNRMDKEGGKV